MAYVAALAAIGQLAYGVYSGERQAAAQRAGVRDQKAAQQEAKQAALHQERLSQLAEGAASAKAPDLNVLLGAQQAPKAGPRGINMSQLLLGAPRLLGQ